MTPTRILALTLPLVVAGCTKPTTFPDPKPAGAYKADAAAATPPPAAAGGAGVGGINPHGAAKDFLAAANAGTATATVLTPEFKKVIAPAVYAEDQAKGYSDAAAEAWLKPFQGRFAAADFPPAEGMGDGVSWLVGTAGKEKVVLRVTPDHQIDWFQATPAVTTMEFPRGKLGADRTVAAVAFLTALLGKDDRLAAGLMTPALREKLAPPFASDKLGYNRGTLERKLADFRGGHTGFTVSAATGATATAALTADGTAAKKTLTLKLAQGPRPWDWLVADIITE